MADTETGDPVIIPGENGAPTQVGFRITTLDGIQHYDQARGMIERLHDVYAPEMIETGKTLKRLHIEWLIKTEPDEAERERCRAFLETVEEDFFKDSPYLTWWLSTQK